MSDDTIYTCAEAADFLKVHKETLLKHARLGNLKSLKVGRSVRFSKTDLMDWVTGDSK